MKKRGFLRAKWHNIRMEIKKKIKHLRQQDICINVNDTNFDKNCLIVYIMHPFLNDGLGGYVHQNQWQVLAMAHILAWFRYNVDVIDYDCGTATPDKEYDLIIDSAPGFAGGKVYEGRTKPNCKKVVYITGSNPEWAANENKKRHQALMARRGVTIKEHRIFLPFSSIVESFDWAFMMGNEYNWQTFTDCFKMPAVHFIPNTGYSFLRSITGDKRDPRKFLFFSSIDQVHKGLDLLLEVFSQPVFPCELYICSSFMAEEEFCKIYEKELFQTANIHAVGYVDIRSDEFRIILESCTYIIIPSCSEGQVGSALTAMSAGLIPILSKACGIDDNEVILLPDCELNTIEKYVMKYSNKDMIWVQERSNMIRDLVMKKYSGEAFTRSIWYGLEKVTGEKLQPTQEQMKKAIMIR